VVNQVDGQRGVGLQGSGVWKKVVGVGLGLFGLAVLVIFGIYVFVEYTNDFSSVPFLSEISSFISAGLLIFGLLVVFIAIKLFSRRDERL